MPHWAGRVVLSFAMSMLAVGQAGLCNHSVIIVCHWYSGPAHNQCLYAFVVVMLSLPGIGYNVLYVIC